MAEFPYESVEEIHAKLIAVKATEDPDPENRIDVSPGSEAWLDAWAEAQRIHALQVMVAARGADILPTTSQDSALDRHAEIHLGEDDDRRPATEWHGYLAFTNESSSSVNVPTGTEAVHADGTRYRTTADKVVAAGSTDVASAESVTAGVVANKANGTELTLASPPGGISGTAFVVDDMSHPATPAKDLENDEELLERILLVTSRRPGGGNAAHYVLLARNATNSVARVFVYPRWFGLGTVLVVPLGEAGSAILHPDVLADVAEAIEAARPCGFAIAVASPVDAEQEVVLQVEPEEGYEPDWSGSFMVASPEGGDSYTRIRVSTDPTAVVGINHHVVALFGSALVPKHLVVVGVGWEAGLGKGYIDVDVEDDGTVSEYAAAGTNVTPGGKLWDPVKAAVAGVFDALGPSRSSAVDLTERYPHPDDEGAPELIVAEIVAAVMGVEGVRDVVVTTPASNITNSAIPGMSPSLLSLGEMFRIEWM